MKIFITLATLALFTVVVPPAHAGDATIRLQEITAESCAVAVVLDGQHQHYNWFAARSGFNEKLFDLLLEFTIEDLTDARLRLSTSDSNHREAEECITLKTELAG